MNISAIINASDLHMTFYTGMPMLKADCSTLVPDNHRSVHYGSVNSRFSMGVNGGGLSFPGNP